MTAATKTKIKYGAKVRLTMGDVEGGIDFPTRWFDDKVSFGSFIVAVNFWGDYHKVPGTSLQLALVKSINGDVSAIDPETVHYDDI